MSEKYLWELNDAEAVLRNVERERKYAMKMERLAKDPLKKAYWHGKASGLLSSINVARWFRDDLKERTLS